MRAKFVLKDKDRGFKALMKNAALLKKSYVRAGVLGEGEKDARRGEDLTNVELAVIHEFGAPGAGIPERSFVRSSFDAGKEKYMAALRKMSIQVYDGRADAKKVLGLIGAQMAADMKGRIAAGIPPPNAPEVLARKQAKGSGAGAPKPLVDTGQLLSSITWAVELGG